jgi:nitrite reductase/ring-hydroxylating ferredoxin subunit
MIDEGVWTLAAAVADVPDGEAFETDIVVGGERVSLFNQGGNFFALGECPHEGAPLGQGRRVGSRILCPWHSAEFEIVSGKCVCGPVACRGGGTVDVAADECAGHGLRDARRFVVRREGDVLYVRVEG